MEVGQKNEVIATEASADYQFITAVISEDKGGGVGRAEGEGEYRLPTDEERRSLSEVCDTVPWSAYALCIFTAIQWGASVGAGTVFWNYLQFPLPKDGPGTGASPAGTQQTPGALGFGLRNTNIIYTSIEFLAPFLRLFTAWLADTKLGRFKIIVLASFITCTYMILLMVSAIPALLRANRTKGPFMLAYCLRVLSTAFFGPAISPLILDQYRPPHDYVRVLANGQAVIVSRSATLSRMQWLFFGIGELGPFISIGTTWAEKKVGFWLAFLVPCLISFCLPAILLAIRHQTIRVSPDGKEFSDFFSVLIIVLKREKFRIFYRSDAWDAAKPSVLRSRGVTVLRKKAITWTDHYVEQVQHTVSACKIFLVFILYNLSGGGIGVVSSSQASSMITNGVPNDLFYNLGNLTTTICMPLFVFGLFPFLRRHGIRYGRIARMTTGLICTSLSSLVGSIIQWRIYQTSPCGYHATNCELGSGVAPLSIWIQSPIYVLEGFAGILVYTAAYEVAYLQAPSHMKSAALAVLLFVSIFSNAISVACAPAISDPNLIWVWAVPGIANLVQTAYLYINYRHLDEETMTRNN
ncbi:hypothetical protein LTR84_003680 [Exophiala bonariae]|uniref:Major facilitator superfamily (MFS) profile domain-containing protein n=1 Tax=Exophiala bonariae TaxID=1690606 RepID=A0AAV9N6Q4_9EURO|nr:hypothetical protein LTR84_003680 [Exophiala bonariae]